MRQKEIALWSSDSSLREQYFKTLESSPVVASHARNNKMWIKYTSFSPADLQVLLGAARELVQRVKVEG